MDRGQGLLSNPSWHYVAQDSLEFVTDPPALVSQILGLQNQTRHYAGLVQYYYYILTQYA